MIDTTKIYDWKYLIREGKNILEDLKKEWENKLDQKLLSENDYHNFIAEHAGFFLDTRQKSLQTISKLLLGSDHETDFVVIHEGFSEGIIYELVELESPHTPAYTKNGQPSARLMAAVQQIHNWKQWLLENRSMFTRMLPNFNKRIIRDTNLRFTIIIGRRDDNCIFRPS